MPNFEKLLREERIDAWKLHYIHYSRLKLLIQHTAKASEGSEFSRTVTNILRRTPTLPKSYTPPTHFRGSGTYDAEFFKEKFWIEVDKAEAFYLKTAAEITEQLSLCFDSVRDICDVPIQERVRLPTPKLLPLKKSDGDCKLSIPLLSAPDSETARHSNAASKHTESRPTSRIVEKKTKQRREQFKKALIELYRQSKFLENFGILNYTACKKILKKWDKLAKVEGLGLLTLPLRPKVLQYSFASPTGEVGSLLKSIEHVFADNFTNQDHIEARVMLLARQTDAWKKRDWRIFILGGRIGILLLLVCWFIWDCVFDSSETAAQEDGDWDTDRDHPLLLIKVTGCITLMYWLWGINVFAWTYARIHFMYILELQQTGLKPVRFTVVFNEAITLTIVFVFTTLLYFKVKRGDFTDDVPEAVYPYICCGFLAWRLLQLPRIFWLTILHCITPFTPAHTRFRDTMMADVITSLVKVFADVAKFANVATILVTALISAFPLLVRLLQNLVLFRETGERWPYLPNATKYAFAEIVVFFGAYHAATKDDMRIAHIIFIIMAVVSTLYTYSWDVLMDWRLGKWEFRGLRKTMLFRHPIFYYTAIVVDLLLRFLWVVSLAPKGLESFFGRTVYYLDPFLGAIELCRRAGWASLRMEAQQITNKSGFRTIGAIPMSFETEEEAAKEEDTWFGQSKMAWLEAFVFILIVLALTIAAVCFL